MQRYVRLGFERYTREFNISEETYNKLLDVAMHNFPTKIKTDRGIAHVSPTEILFVEVR